MIPSREPAPLCRVQNPVDTEEQFFYTDRAYRNSCDTTIVSDLATGRGVLTNGRRDFIPPAPALRSTPSGGRDFLREDVIQEEYPPSSNRDRAGKHMAKLKLKTHLINRDWCKGCGICVHFCPKKVLELDDQEKVVAVRPQDCVCCKLCELRCPDLAIEVQTEQD